MDANIAVLIEYYKILIIQNIRSSMRLINLVATHFNDRKDVLLNTNADAFITLVLIAFKKGFTKITLHELNKYVTSASVCETPCTEVDTLVSVIQDVITDLNATYDTYDTYCIIRYTHNDTNMKLTFERMDEQHLLLLLKSKFENKL